MRTSNFGRERHLIIFFRLCLVVLVALILALGVVVQNTEPVRAIGISADPVPPINVPECTPFTIQFTATGTVCIPPPDPFFWIWGPAPAWITLDPNTGLLTGCAPVGEDGNTYNFSVGVSEFAAFPPCGPFINAMPVTINVTGAAPPCDMVIDPTFYPVAWENIPFAMTLSVTGGVGPFEWAATDLPAGLSVTDTTNGIISGTPALGTCGIYTVTATVTDTGTCCCPPVSRPFILIVDCWANYPPIFYYTTACDFSVEIGPGLTQGQTKVLIDGSHKTTLVGGQSETFTSIPCESHIVVVDQVIPGADPQTRFTVTGSNQKIVTDVDNYAYFDYVQEVHIGTSSDPAGLTQPPGAGFYTVGNYFSSTAPSTIDSYIQNGIKYVFREWKLPDGSTIPARDLAFTVNQSGTATAVYDTYYMLTLKSDYPPIEEHSWEPQGSVAAWNLSLSAVPMESGFWAFLGGTISPVNSSGTQTMNGPSTVEILWRHNYTVPIIAIVIILLVIAGLIYLAFRLRARRPVAQATTPTVPEKTPSSAKKRATKKPAARKRTSR